MSVLSLSVSGFLLTCPLFVRRLIRFTEKCVKQFMAGREYEEEESEKKAVIHKSLGLRR